MKFLKTLFLLLPFISFSQFGVPIRGEYLYMSQTEVSNKQYMNFLKSLSKEDSLKNLPKSEMWKSRTEETNPMEQYYFLHSAYQNYPVVNITHEQAIAYCEKYTELLNRTYPNQKVLVRLPTEKEWEEAAKAGNHFAIYPWGTETMRVKSGKRKGQLLANFLRGRGSFVGASGEWNQNIEITAPVMSYWPNDFGLYNMSGNVSEMVAEKGLVKGGSWRNRADWLQIGKKQYVYSASPEVGFRYVVEVVELPKDKESFINYQFSKKFYKKHFVKISDTISFGKFEVTNKMFKSYLRRLCGDSTKHSKVESNNWSDLFPYSELWANNYATNSKFENYPVVNVDYETAMKFCRSLEWRYENLFDEEVEIRLPTEQEWEFAARGGLKNSPYPWGGPYVRNSKGDFLANHNPKMNESENVFGYDTLSLNNFFQTYFTDLHDFDGEPVLAPVDSYHPNDFGIYNMAGNAAEMVLDSNFTKGGSWKSKSDYLQIDSKEKWNKQANPFTGFRIVMIKKNS